MARETNFVDLYQLLDLKPGCELGEFKQAYRRRVAMLHPDRRSESRDDFAASERLQHLTALYSSAIEFERRHGRLPGALHARPAGAAGADTAANTIPASSAMARPGNARKLWAGVALAMVAAWLVWSPPWQTDNADSDESAAASLQNAVDAGRARAGPASPAMIRVGTTTEAVRAIEGEPMLINGNRWEYGPSWIYFQGNAVVDWHSSSLHPLETSSPQPQPADK